ncbi:hypothetical protein K2173_018815 [Erythroxylum novogranatense]|uniref:Uncharacterized protein n=1 Tax=Erythroxylum novogranatense TaxID=1862640 RepID=A0AAV8SAU2_9ROSI|nr:hypothetical protein K2173_018815 [Erythroxylum novogranatense]
MSTLIRIAIPPLPLPHHLGFNDHPCVSMRISRLFHLKTSSLYQKPSRRFCSINSDSEAYGLSVSRDNTPKHEGSADENESSQKSVTSNEVLTKLKRYGISGVLAYGLLNTAYYLTTFLLVWFYVAPAPGKLGFLAAVERFFKVMATVWAGSQVTKLARAGGALALAPFVDEGLSWFTIKFKFDSQGKV